MKFGALNSAWLFLLVPLLVIFYRWAFLKKGKMRRAFADLDLWDRLRVGLSPGKQRLKPILIVLVAGLLAFSLLEPRWGYRWEDIRRRGIDLLVAVDTSKSMLADDIKPSRLARAKREVEDLLGLVRGDRVGLIAFAGRAFVLCPLTLDYGALRIFINDLSVSTIPRGGSNIGAAIEKAIDAFETGPGKHKALLLITDGENLEGDYEAAARKAKQEDIRIFTIGIGGEEGTPITLTDERGSRYLKDREGNIVVSKLNESALQKIALLTGGAYHRATPRGLELDLIYKDRIAKMDKKKLETTRKKIYEHRFQWPLAVALALLFLESILGEKKGNSLKFSKLKKNILATE